MNEMLKKTGHLLHRTLMLMVMIAMAGATMALAQSSLPRTISGIVVDENGEPLPAAQVLREKHYLCGQNMDNYTSSLLSSIIK